MKCTFPAKDKDLLKKKIIARNMLALNCMLGKNKSKTLYNCNCLSVVVNVYVKDSQLFMIIEGMPIIILCFQILVISV